MDHEYYMNKATKNDQNIYLKTDYSITDKINLFFTLIPIIFGVVLYIWAGTTVYDFIMSHGESSIQTYIDSESTGKAIYYVLAFIFTA